MVYLTSDGSKFLSKDSAERYEYECHNKKEEKEKDMQEKLSAILETVLKDNNWGVYYKSIPLSNLPVDGGAPMFKVNDVQHDTLINAIRRTIADTEVLNDTQG